MIKVETPGGDDSRGWGPPFVGPQDDPVSTCYLSANRDKEPIRLDLEAEADSATPRSASPRHWSRGSEPVGASSCGPRYWPRSSVSMPSKDPVDGRRRGAAGEWRPPPGDRAYGSFRAADGMMQSAIGNGRQWRAFAACLGLDPEDPRFTSPRRRIEHRAELIEPIEEPLSQGLLVEVDHPTLGRDGHLHPPLPDEHDSVVRAWAADPIPTSS